jgi:addiction module RelE/StbE family toxin
MKIIYKKKFEKRLTKLPPKLKQKTLHTIEKFIKNPHDPTLRNHALKGALYGVRAFSVTGDIRVIFKPYDNYVVVVMLDVGIHNQVY